MDDTSALPATQDQQETKPPRQQPHRHPKELNLLLRDLAGLRRASVGTYRDDMTQYTVLGWVAGAAQQGRPKPHPEGKGPVMDPFTPYPTATVVPRLGVMAVGFTGHYDNRYNHVPRIATVFAPVEIDRTGRFVTGRSVCRTLTGPVVDAAGVPLDAPPGKTSIYQSYPGFCAPDETAQAAAALTYARQLLHVVTTQDGWQSAVDRNVVGPAALGSPVACVKVRRPVSPDGAPQPPAVVPLADAQITAMPKDDDVVWDVESVPPGYDIASPARSGRLTPIGLPWAVLNCHVRCVYAELGDLTVHWSC